MHLHSIEFTSSCVTYCPLLKLIVAEVVHSSLHRLNIEALTNSPTSHRHTTTLWTIQNQANYNLARPQSTSPVSLSFLSRVLTTIIACIHLSFVFFFIFQQFFRISVQIQRFVNAILSIDETS